MTFAVKGIRRSDDVPAVLRWDDDRGWSADSRTMHDLLRFYGQNVNVWVTPAGPPIPNDPCDGLAASLVALALLREPCLTQGELPGIPGDLLAAVDPEGRALTARHRSS